MDSPDKELDEVLANIDDQIARTEAGLLTPRSDQELQAVLDRVAGLRESRRIIEAQLHRERQARR